MERSKTHAPQSNCSSKSSNKILKNHWAEDRKIRKASKDQIDTENLHRKTPGENQERLDKHHQKPLQEHLKGKSFIYKH